MKIILSLKEGRDYTVSFTFWFQSSLSLPLENPPYRVNMICFPILWPFTHKKTKIIVNQSNLQLLKYSKFSGIVNLSSLPTRGNPSLIYRQKIQFPSNFVYAKVVQEDIFLRFAPKGPLEKLIYTSIIWNSKGKYK